MLSEHAMERRRGKVTATMARDIMNASSDAELLQIYDRAIGATPPDPENYAMRAGAAMEPVIINEYELRTGEQLQRRQEIVDHPTIPDFMATLDGWQASANLIVEAKFASPFMSKDELFRRFYPQCAFQMACVDAVGAVLLIGQGTTEPIEIECVRDLSYEMELLQRCEAFLLCIKTLCPPSARPIVVPPEKWRTVDLTSDERPNWAAELFAALVEYDETTEAAIAHEEYGKIAKSLVPDDVGRVISLNHIIARNKRGTLAITRRAA